MESLATEFGPYHCEKLYTLGLLRSANFISAIVGSIFFMFAEECIGKRKMYLGGMLLISLGMLLMFLSQRWQWQLLVR